jgi:hypothetical protein
MKAKERPPERGPIKASAPWVALEVVGHLDRLQSLLERRKNNN